MSVAVVLDDAPSELGGRLLKGVGSSALRQAVGTVEPVLLVPLFLAGWGFEDYGRWLTLTGCVVTRRFEAQVR